MKSLILGLIVCLTSSFLFAQEQPESQTAIDERNAQLTLEWMSNLYAHGVSVEGDSIIVSIEIQNLINNKVLREFMYPDVYTWDNAVALLQKMELKRAFWFFINLYPENKELILTAILKYDHIFEMEKVLLGSFYTYAMVDPSVSSIVDGKPVINRPDLVEAKLEIVKEMIDRTLYYRSTSSRN